MTLPGCPIEGRLEAHEHPGLNTGYVWQGQPDIDWRLKRGSMHPFVANEHAPMLCAAEIGLVEDLMLGRYKGAQG